MKSDPKAAQRFGTACRLEPSSDAYTKEYTMKSTQEQYKVTDSQLDAATRYIECKTNTVFYLVQSATNADVQYQVRWNRKFSRFACQCKASHNGMNCWHVRSAVANEVLYRENIRAEAEAAQRIAEEKAEYERLLMVPPTRPNRTAVERPTPCNQPKPFSILR